jgi:hypothetical protein
MGCHNTRYRLGRHRRESGLQVSIFLLSMMTGLLPGRQLTPRWTKASINKPSINYKTRTERVLRQIQTLVPTIPRSQRGGLKRLLVDRHHVFEPLVVLTWADEAWTQEPRLRLANDAPQARRKRPKDRPTIRSEGASSRQDRVKLLYSIRARLEQRRSSDQSRSTLV